MMQATITNSTTDSPFFIAYVVLEPPAMPAYDPTIETLSVFPAGDLIPIAGLSDGSGKYFLSAVPALNLMRLPGSNGHVRHRPALATGEHDHGTYHQLFVVRFIGDVCQRGEPRLHVSRETHLARIRMPQSDPQRKNKTYGPNTSSMARYPSSHLSAPISNSTAWFGSTQREPSRNGTSGPPSAVALASREGPCVSLLPKRAVRRYRRP
jgi:hypothetical protein